MQRQLSEEKKAELQIYFKAIQIPDDEKDPNKRKENILKKIKDTEYALRLRLLSAVDNIKLDPAAQLNEVKEAIRSAFMIDVEDRMGNTPLMFAARHARYEVMELLIEKGANVNHQSKDGYTPLMEAVIGKNPSCVAALIQAGANVTLQSKDGFSALRLAKSLGLKQCEILIQKALAENQTGPTFFQPYRPQKETNDLQARAVLTKG